MPTTFGDIINDSKVKPATPGNDGDIMHKHCISKTNDCSNESHLPYDLTDSYINNKFNNNVYKVFPYKWYQCYRPHITGKTSPRDGLRRQSFSNENCELIKVVYAKWCNGKPSSHFTPFVRFVSTTPFGTNGTHLCQHE